MPLDHHLLQKPWEIKWRSFIRIKWQVVRLTAKLIYRQRQIKQAIKPDRCNQSLKGFGKASRR